MTKNKTQELEEIKKMSLTEKLYNARKNITKLKKSSFGGNTKFSKGEYISHSSATTELKKVLDTFRIDFCATTIKAELMERGNKGTAYGFCEVSFLNLGCTFGAAISYADKTTIIKNFLMEDNNLDMEQIKIEQESTKKENNYLQSNQNNNTYSREHIISMQENIEKRIDAITNKADLTKLYYSNKVFIDYLKNSNDNYCKLTYNSIKRKISSKQEEIKSE
jgi:hypothetical protein